MVCIQPSIATYLPLLFSPPCTKGGVLSLGSKPSEEMIDMIGLLPRLEDTKLMAPRPGYELLLQSLSDIVGIET